MATNDQPGLFGPAEIRVPITDPETQAEIGVLLGLRTSHDAMASAKWAHQLAGFRIALALVEAEMAQQQLRVSQRVQRLLARSGVDLASMHAQTFQGVAAVVCRPYQEAPADMRDDGAEAAPE